MVKNKLNNCQASRHEPCDEVQVRDQQMGVSLSPVLAQQARTLSIHQACWLFFFFFFFFSFLSSFVVLYVHINHTAYLERRWVQDGQLDFHTPPELLQMLLYVTETVRLIRDGEPRTATSIRLFTQFLSIFKCCFQSQLLVQTTLFTVSI